MKTNRQGYIQLLFENRHGRTVASEVYHEGNSRVSSHVRLNRENTPYYFLINSGGGFVEGEQYEIDIKLEPETRAILTSQAPTYIYKCENNKLTSQKTTITLGENSFLEYITDEVIPYRNSYYRQETTVHLTDTSTLILEDGVTAGWSEDQSPFSYASLQMKTTLYMNGKLFYHDFLLTDPKEERMSSLGYFEEYTNYNNIIVISPHCTKEFIQELRQDLKEQVKNKTFKADFGLSELDHSGFIVRTLGHTAEDNRKVLLHVINFFREKAMSFPPLELGKNQ